MHNLVSTTLCMCCSQTHKARGLVVTLDWQCPHSCDTQHCYQFSDSIDTIVMLLLPHFSPSKKRKCLEILRLWPYLLLSLEASSSEDTEPWVENKKTRRFCKHLHNFTKRSRWGPNKKTRSNPWSKPHVFIVVFPPALQPSKSKISSCSSLPQLLLFKCRLSPTSCCCQSHVRANSIKSTWICGTWKLNISTDWHIMHILNFYTFWISCFLSKWSSCFEMFHFRK